MRRSGLGLLLALAMPALIRAAQDQEPTLTAGAGARSCAQFSVDCETAPELMEELYFTWTQGYLTGFARASAAARSGRHANLTPPGRSVDWQKSYVREYCGSHPLSPYSEAAASLTLEILKANQSG